MYAKTHGTICTIHQALDTKHYTTLHYTTLRPLLPSLLPSPSLPLSFSRRRPLNVSLRSSSKCE